MNKPWNPIETAPKDGTEILVALFKDTFNHFTGYSVVKWADFADDWRVVGGVGDRLYDEPLFWQLPDKPPCPHDWDEQATGEAGISVAICLDCGEARVTA